MPFRDLKTGRFTKKPMSASSESSELCESPPSTTSSKKRLREWNGGRRIVELSTLAKNLAKCTGKSCMFSLDLQNIEGETRCGLGSYLHIRCQCGKINRVKTCETHNAGKGRPVFNVNTVAAAAMIDTGMSQASLQKFAASLDIHPPHLPCDLGVHIMKILTQS